MRSHLSELILYGLRSPVMVIKRLFEVVISYIVDRSAIYSSIISVTFRTEIGRRKGRLAQLQLNKIGTHPLNTKSTVTSSCSIAVSPCSSFGVIRKYCGLAGPTLFSTMRLNTMRSLRSSIPFEWQRRIQRREIEARERPVTKVGIPVKPRHSIGGATEKTYVPD